MGSWITSPYGPEARYSTKRGSSRVEYKVQFTETCDAETPRLTTNVETTPATTPDDNMVELGGLPATYGNTTSDIVSYSIKSGTDEFHGSALLCRRAPFRRTR